MVFLEFSSLQILKGLILLLSAGLRIFYVRGLLSLLPHEFRNQITCFSILSSILCKHGGMHLVEFRSTFQITLITGLYSEIRCFIVLCVMNI